LNGFPASIKGGRFWKLTPFGAYENAVILDKGLGEWLAVIA